MKNARQISAYDGTTFMGALRITERGLRKRGTVAASDSRHKTLGSFKTQKAALQAIDKAFAKSGAKRGS